MLETIKASHAVVAWALRALATVFVVSLTTPSYAAVEYVRICSLYGAGFFYIPGADTCADANQTVTDQFAIARAQTRASTGTAMVAAMVNPFLPNGTNYAISTHWAVFDGQHAVGFAGLIRLTGDLSLSAGFALGLDRGNLLTLSNRTATEFGVSFAAQSWSDVRAMGRIGLQYAW